MFPWSLCSITRIDLTRARCTDVDIVVAWGDLTTEMGPAGGPGSTGASWDLGPRKPRENYGKTMGKTRKNGD